MYGSTPMEQAGSQGYVEVVKALLAAGADARAKNSMRTLMHADRWLQPPWSATAQRSRDLQPQLQGASCDMTWQESLLRPPKGIGTRLHDCCQRLR